MTRCPAARARPTATQAARLATPAPASTASASTSATTRSTSRAPSEAACSHLVTLGSSTTGWASASAFHDMGSDRPSSHCSSLGAHAGQVVLVCLRTQHPVPHVGVELALGRGIGRRAPVRDVLAVAADGQARRVAPAGVRAVGRLHDGQHPVAGNPHPVPEPFEVVHDALDGGHDATTGCPRAPDAVEQRLGEDQVARRGRPRPHGRGRRRARAAAADPAGRTGESTTVNASFVLHGGPDERPGDRRRESAGGRLEPLRQGEDRPVLDLDRHRTRRPGGRSGWACTWGSCCPSRRSPPCGRDRPGRRARRGRPSWS